MNMKIRISDVSSALAPESLEVRADKERSERIKSSVMEKIGEKAPKRSHKPFKTVLIAAAIAAALCVSAGAVAHLSIQYHDINNDEGVTDHWVDYDKDNNIIMEDDISFPDAKFTFSFQGPEYPEGPDLELKANWLPSKPTGHSYFDRFDRDKDLVELEDGYALDKWVIYITDDGYNLEIPDAKIKELPYIISVSRISCNLNYILQGYTEVIKDEMHEQWHILELKTDYTDCGADGCFKDNTAYYFYAVNESDGTKISISGTDDMETLEKIAKNLEIREADFEPEENCPVAYSERKYVMADIGRG